MTRQASNDAIEAVALLDEPNRRRLYELIATSDHPVGRDEAAAALGMSRELAAFHLDQLAGAALLETEYRRLGDRPGQGGGRPSKLYRRSQRDVSVSLPQREYERAAEVFADALAALPASGGTKAVAEVGRARGRQAGLAARRSSETSASGGRVELPLLDLLRDGGYEPERDEAGAVVLRNCPYHALADRHRELTCGMNFAWAEGVLDGLGGEDLALEQRSAPGYCCIAFTPRR